MAGTEPLRITTISELHSLMGLPRPEHPLISVISFDTIKRSQAAIPGSRVFDFYTISLKRHCHGSYKYGQQRYTAQEGIMYFMAPGQVFGPPVITDDSA